MYNSIVSVELVSHMKPQFAGIVPAAEEAGHVPATGRVRRRMGAALRALANRLDAAPAAR